MTTADDRAEALKSPATFNARAAVNNATYPTDSIDVYSDAALAHRVNIAAHEAAKARAAAETAYNYAYNKSLAEANATTDPEAEAREDASYKTLDAEATELEAEVAKLLPGLQDSKLTFHLRGLAPAQWRNIHKLGYKEIKDPVRKHFEKGEDGDEEFQNTLRERNIDRINWINDATIAAAIVKVVNPEGAEDTGVWKVEDVANLSALYLESEYNKLKNLTEQLTFANTIFQNAVEQDVDFLPKH